MRASAVRVSSAKWAGPGNAMARCRVSVSDAHDKRQRTMAPILPDEELNDQQLAEEILLLGELMLAATSAGRAMTDAEIDEALRLSVGTITNVQSHTTQPVPRQQIS
jgi:hypothetical protein